MEDHQRRNKLYPTQAVMVAVKKNGKYQEELVFGYIMDILTNSKTHHRGIKVRLSNGVVGRVQKIVEEEE